MKCLSNLLVVLGLAPVLFAAWSQQSSPPGRIATEGPHTEADVKAIQEYFQGYVAAAKAGDLDGYRKFWTDDVVWLPPDAPLTEGIEACMDRARPQFEELIQEEAITVEEIKFATAFTFVRVNYTYKGTPKGDGEPVEEDGKGVFLMKRKPDGSWVSTHCVWNSNLPRPE